MDRKLTYCFSAPNYLRLYFSKWLQENPEKDKQLTQVIALGLERVRQRCRVIMGDDSLKTSMLFNGYTEHRHGKYFNDRGRFGFDQLYADSGGLQVVTTGKTLTNDLKLQIYENQKAADFGFCFDEIPLGMKNEGDTNAKHRSQTEGKLFFPEGFDDCAIRTAMNIKEQTAAFKGSNTKAFYIVQGNTTDEMYRWFKKGVEIVQAEGFEQIQGVAPADTCMGNGALESVDMMVAYHRMIEDFGQDFTKKHLHLLGVGSPGRLLPAVFLKESGFIPQNVELSFDSSSSSMSYVMGNFFDSDGTRPNRDRVKTLAMFERFWDDMGDLIQMFSPGIQKDWYLEWTKEHYKSVSSTVRDLPDEEYDVGMRASITLCCIWQNIGFFTKLRQDMSCDETRQTGVGYLNEVKNMTDYLHWKRHFERFCSSKRISRRQETSLLDLFE
jgi:hypothetical protein